MAAFWAICCLMFSAGNDFVFKAYARKARSNGYFIFIIGVVSLLTSCCFLRQLPQNWGATIFWGLISGFFSIGGNILMLEAMRTLDGGVCSTIYRLNMVPAVLGASLLLGEKISVLDWCGIGCAMIAIIGFIPRGSSRKAALLPLFLMICASFMRAAMGLSYSYGFAHGADKGMVTVITNLYWVFGGLLYTVPERKRMEVRFSRKLCAYGVGSGVLVAGIVLTMASSLALGPASVVLPIAQMSFILTGILGALFLKEKLTFLKIGGVLAGAAAIILLSL